MNQRKSWITAAVMVGLAVALFAYIFLVEAKRDPPPEPGARPTPVPLWTFEAQALTRIAVTRGEQETAVERTGTGWRMVEPEENEADGLRLEGLVFQLVEAGYTSAIEDAEDLGQYGLEPPELTVTLVLTDQSSIELDVGDENPGGNARYVLKGDESTIYLVPTYVMREVVSLVDNPPYPPTPTPVMTIPSAPQ